jgi:hypothetical protein
VNTGGADAINPNRANTRSALRCAGSANTGTSMATTPKAVAEQSDSVSPSTSGAGSGSAVAVASHVGATHSATDSAGVTGAVAGCSGSDSAVVSDSGGRQPSEPAGPRHCPPSSPAPASTDLSALQTLPCDTPVAAVIAR